MKHVSGLGVIVCVAIVAALPARADYVADDSEIAAMKAKIIKNPPTAATLTAEPYPGSKLDAECSADQSASNQPQTMVYCLYTKDPIEKVKEYLEGPGKPGPGVTAYVDRADVAENGYVKVADVTQVRYYVRAQKPAAAAAPAPAPATPGTQTAAAATATPAAPPASTTAAAPAAKQAPAAPAPAADKEDASDGTQAVQDAVSTVKKLKGLFGGG